MSRLKPNQSIDYLLLALVGALILFGLVMLTSASGPTGYQKPFNDSLYFLKHQVFFGLVPGTVFLFLMTQVPYHFWKRHAWESLIVSIVLLVLVFIPGLGSEFGTSRSWITLGGLFSLQPAEVVKLTFLFYLAAWLEQRGEHGVKDVHAGFIPFVSVLGAIMLLMVLQPDVGSMSIIAGISLAVYFVAGAPILHIVGLVAGGASALALLIASAEYRAARFMTFLHPELDPSGVGYHINQALLAIGSGGFLGLGYGHSRQKFQYLPEVSGDSIFAVIAEEMGFVISVALLALILVIFWRAIKIGLNAPDAFGKYVAIGIGCWFAVQSFVNIGSMVSIMPMTGVTLPFVSYGGTSLAISMTAVGVLLNISRYGKSKGAA